MNSQNQIDVENLKIANYMGGITKIIPTATKTKTIITFQHPGRAYIDGKSVYLIEDLHYHDYEERILPVVTALGKEYGVVMMMNNKTEAGIFNRIDIFNPKTGKELLSHTQSVDYPVARWLWEAVVELLENPWMD